MYCTRKQPGFHVIIFLEVGFQVLKNHICVGHNEKLKLEDFKPRADKTWLIPL